MELKNLTLDEAKQALCSALPFGDDFIKLCNEIGISDVQLQKLETINPVITEKRAFSRGQSFYAWTCWHKRKIYFVIPGEDEVSISGEQNFRISHLKFGESVPVVIKKDVLQTQTANYQLIADRFGSKRLVPEWWLDAERVNAYYSSNPKKTKHCLQEIVIGDDKFLAWRFASAKPCAVHWFIIENGSFVSACDSQRHHFALPQKQKNAFVLSGSILRFK